VRVGRRRWATFRPGQPADSSEIPAAAEPFFQGLDAKVTFSPVTNADEMAAGVGKAMQAA
jgi:hypothetical protein